jgi:hypothetical protein
MRESPYPRSPSNCLQMKIRDPAMWSTRALLACCATQECSLFSPEQEIETCVYSRAVPNALLTARCLHFFTAYLHYGRAIGQASRVGSQDRSRGICGGKSGTGAGFLRVLRFPLPILVPLNAPNSSIILG